MNDWDWILIFVLAPFIIVLALGGLFVASSFVIWIAALLAAVLIAGVIATAITATLTQIKRGLSWLKALRH